MYVLQNLHWFALLIGALVFFHELGHFVVAKLFDVQVTRFSLGFGPRILGFTRGETEYTLSLLPLGGYVKMAGEELDDTSGEPGRGLASKPLYQRSLIVLAGPAANLLLAFVVYLSMFVGNHTFGDTLLGVVTANDPAYNAGLRPGDRITAVDGQPVAEWDELQAYIGERPEQDVSVTFLRGEQTAVAKVHTATRQEMDPFGQLQARGKIGVSLQYVLPVVAILDDASPAAKAGLKTGDRITAVDGHSIRAWHEVASLALASAGPTLDVGFEREQKPMRAKLTMAPLVPALAALARQTAADGAGPNGYTGLVSLEACVSEVRPGSPAALAGLMPMDRLLTAVLVKPAAKESIRRPISVWSVDLAALGLEAGDELTLELQRKTEVRTIKLACGQAEQVDEYKQVHASIDVGATNAPGLLESYTRDAPVGLLRAGREATFQVWTDMSLIGQGIAKMVQGRVPLGSMGGPIMLFVIAEKSAKRGWDSFGRAMAMTSVNLGLLNVLPVPVLDGGHLLFYGIEAVTRRPASARVREVANMVGLGMLLLLMAVVFRNDISRFLLGNG